MNVLDLFSGIGGFSLGLERAGMRTVAFCEIEPYCRAVLKKHWPNVPCFEDVRKLTAGDIQEPIDIICGGFPCQDISVAGSAWGTNKGIDGERSGLWSEFFRLIGEIRPKFVIVENVAALLGRGVGRVLGDLAEIGYDAEWRIVGANELGASHRRERLWIVAYPNYINVARNIEEKVLGFSLLQRIVHSGSIAPFPIRPAIPGAGLSRKFNGVPFQVDRIKSIGNAVVPQIPELIGRAILEAA